MPSQNDGLFSNISTNDRNSVSLSASEVSIMFLGRTFLDLFGGISWIAKPDGQSHIASDFCKGFEILYAARTC